MSNLEIITNPKNTENVENLFMEVYPDSIPYKIKEVDIVLTVDVDEFDFPLAFAILNKDKDTLIIKYHGVKNEFKNEGIWEYLYSYIEFFAEKEGCSYIKEV